MNKNWLFFLLGTTLLIAINSFFIVDQRKQAIVFQFGEAVNTIKQPGLHFKIPLIQDVKYFDKRLLNYDLNAQEIQAQDKKRVIISAFVKYKIVDVLKFYQAVGTQYEADSRLYSILDSSLRQVIGKSPSMHLLSDERVEIMANIEKIVNVKSKRFGIDIEDVRLLRTDLPKENSQAIFRRMQSDREKEAKTYRAQGVEESEKIRSLADKNAKIITVNAYKQGQIIRGKGDALSTKIYTAAYAKDPQFYDFYKSMQVYKQVFNNSNTKLVISPDNDFMKFFMRHKSQKSK